MTNEVEKSRERLADELADLCADALREAGFPIEREGRLWQALYAMIQAEVKIS